MVKKTGKITNQLFLIYGEKNLEKIEGFDKAIIGVEVKSNKLIYSVKKCINILKTKMPVEEVIDHFYTEIFSENKRSKKVIFCENYLIKKTNI